MILETVWYNLETVATPLSLSENISVCLFSWYFDLINN